MFPFEWPISKERRIVVQHNGVDQALPKARNPSSLLCCHCCILLPAPQTPTAVSLQPWPLSSWEAVNQSRYSLSYSIISHVTFEDQTYFFHLICNPHLIRISLGSIYIQHLSPNLDVTTFIFSSCTIYQLPSGNLQYLEQRRFPYVNTYCLAFCKPDDAMPSPSLLFFCFSPILLRTYCYSIDLDGNLTVSVSVCFILFLRQIFLTDHSRPLKIHCITHCVLYISYRVLSKLSPNSTHSSGYSSAPRLTIP